jgi:hypothetical protein
MNDERKTIDVTWVVWTLGMVVVAIVALEAGVVVGQRGVASDTWLDHDRARAELAKQATIGVPEPEMKIDFGDIELNCRLQNFLEYDMGNPGSHLTRTGTTLTYQTAWPASTERHYLSRPLLDVTENTFKTFGMQYELAVTDFTNAGALLSGCTGDAVHAVGNSIQQYDIDLAFKGVLHGDIAYSTGQAYTVQVARYPDNDAYTTILRLLQGEAVIASHKISDPDTSDYLGYSSIDLYVLDLQLSDPIDSATLSIANLYVSGASPVLPQIRNTPNLGKLLIRPGGNT